MGCLKYFLACKGKYSYYVNQTHISDFINSFSGMRPSGMSNLAPTLFA